MKKEYWIVVFTQGIYVLIALFVAWVLWKYLPEVNEAFFTFGPVRGGGAFAGFAFVWWFLYKTGPINAAKLVTIQGIQAGIILTPSKKEEYNALFGGFKNYDYYAFNAPFKLEGQPGDHLFEEALATHEKRYLEGGVKSHYLFFDKDSHDRAQSFFQRLEGRLGKEKLKESIKILNWKNPREVPSYTFFIGYKGKKPVCIFYPSAAVHEGRPEAIIYIEGAEDFFNILKRHFQKKWDEAMQDSG